MITMRSSSLALAVAAGILSTQAMAVDFTGYARSGIGWTAAAASSNVSKRQVQTANTVSVTNVRRMQS